MDEIDEAHCRKLTALLQLVAFRARDNERFFNSKHDVIDLAFRDCFAAIATQINATVSPTVADLFKVAARYDADSATRANGVRSWLATVSRLALELNATCAFVETSRQSVLFRRVKTVQQLKSLADYLAAVGQCLEVVKTYTELSPESAVVDIALDNRISLPGIVDVISVMRLINVGALRGRTHFFHYDSAVAPVVNGIFFTFAAYCQLYKPADWISSTWSSSISQQQDETASLSSSNTSSSGDDLVSLGSCSSSSPSCDRPPSSKNGIVSFFTSSYARADDVQWGLANLSLESLKNFWQKGDHPLVLASADLILPSITLSCGINVHSVPITLPSTTTDCHTEVTLEPPGLEPVKCRIISSVIRQGQEYWLHNQTVSPSRLKPPSDTIVFQVHGGGFICQSARSGELFLRRFAIETQVPFFCVDYSLLPDPFPKQVDEVVFTFAWMLQNMAKLGATGRRIVAFGDSAGCCLLLSMCVRLLQLNLRLPDALELAYPYTCASFAPSPSRLLSFSDPIMPIPLLLRLSFGYAQLDESDVRTILGIADTTRLTSSAPESMCSSPLSSSSGTETSPPRQLRQCKTAPGKLFDQLSRKRDSGIELDREIEQETTLDFCYMPFSNSERLDVNDMLRMPIFADPVFTPLMAPYDILARFPHVSIVATNSDPLLDDSIELCRRIRRAGAKCDLEVLDGLPHGFLNLAIVSGACRVGSDRVIKNLCQLVKN